MGGLLRYARDAKMLTYKSTLRSSYPRGASYLAHSDTPIPLQGCQARKNNIIRKSRARTGKMRGARPQANRSVLLHVRIRRRSATKQFACHHRKKNKEMKKAVFIAYNQALTERVDYILKQLKIKGFTQWPVVNGAGTFGGEPRMGTHTWPEMNSATLTVVEEEMVPLLLKYVQKLDEVNKENGIRAFVWDITSLY